MVEPVETRSTIASARPSRGATSTAPEIEMTSAAMDREEASGCVGVGGRDAEPRELLDRLVGGVGRDGRREPATAEAQRPEPGQLGTGLDKQVDAGDAQVGDTVADELDHVVGPDEQDVEVEVLDACDEAPVMLVEHEAGVVEESEGRFDETALVGNRETEALPHRSVPVG
jgi:hypothetical protein